VGKAASVADDWIRNRCFTSSWVSRDVLLSCSLKLYTEFIESN